MISAQRRQDHTAPGRTEVPGDGAGGLGDRARQLTARARRQQPFRGTDHADRAGHRAVTAQDRRRDTCVSDGGLLVLHRVALLAHLGQRTAERHARCFGPAGQRGQVTGHRGSTPGIRKVGHDRMPQRASMPGDRRRPRPIDGIDILKDGASAIYGSDAVAGVFNIFLKHKFRGLEIGGSIGNTNLGASNDARELETWMIAGTGDDKTDIVIIADAYDRAAIYSRDRNITSNANYKAWGGGDGRSFADLPGRVITITSDTSDFFQLLPGIITPTPHSFPNVAKDPQYINISSPAVPRALRYPDGNFQAYNFAALTPSIPAADRQSFYGSFTRDICDKYLTVFADFKYTRSFFDSALAATPFQPDPFKQRNGEAFSPRGISVPLQNPFNPFTVADATLPDGTPVTTGVHFRAINDTGVRTLKTTFRDILFDAGIRGQMGEFGDYFKNWNWELGFRYSRNDEENDTGGVVSKAGLRAALLDTDPATAFNPFLGYQGRNTEAAINRVYVNLHATGQFELPLAYFHLDGDLFNLPAGPVSFAGGLEYPRGTVEERSRLGEHQF